MIGMVQAMSQVARRSTYQLSVEPPNAYVISSYEYLDRNVVAVAVLSHLEDTNVEDALTKELGRC